MTATKGTLRRKKQMREFLEAYDDGYEDNLFDSTPYRNRNNKVKVEFAPITLKNSS